MLAATDFDGTLAEIVADPSAARPAAGAQAALAVLAARRDFAVAVVSGRSLADLRARCAVAGAWYIGGHGNEIQGPAPEAAHAATAGSDAAAGDEADQDGPALVGQLAAEIRARLAQWPGAWLERKPWSAAIHYRHAPASADAILSYAAALAASRGFRLVPGNCIAELLPQGARNKGQTLLDLRGRLRCDLALYFGDESTDEDVFAAADDNLVGIHVGPPSGSGRPHNGDDAAGAGPVWDDRSTAAAYWLASPAEVVEVLRSLGAWRDGAAERGVAPVNAEARG